MIKLPKNILPYKERIEFLSRNFINFEPINSDRITNKEGSYFIIHPSDVSICYIGTSNSIQNRMKNHLQYFVEDKEDKKFYRMLKKNKLRLEDCLVYAEEIDYPENYYVEALWKDYFHTVRFGCNAIEGVERNLPIPIVAKVIKTSEIEFYFSANQAARDLREKGFKSASSGGIHNALTGREFINPSGNKSNKRSVYGRVWATHKEYNQNTKVLDYKISNLSGPFSNIKIVEQWTREGIYLNTYPSAYHAERETDIHRGNIYRCCKGKINHAGGYIWRYADVETN